MNHSSAARAPRVTWRLWLLTLCLGGLGLLGGCNSLPTVGGSAASGSGIQVDASSGTAAPQADRSTRRGAGSLWPSDTLQPIQPGSTYSLTVTSLTPPADLWDRIRRGFAMPDLEGDLVRDRVDWYATRPDYMFRMTERSRKYLFHIVEELERRDMPTELALLPFIESAVNPQAVSSA